jgi:hypothetical protein
MLMNRIAIILLSTIAMVAGCHRAAIRRPSASPTDTACNYYWVLNNGTAEEERAFNSKDYFDHFARLSPELQKALSFENVSKMVTKNHTVTSVDVVKVTFPSYGASVTVRLHFKDGSTQVYNADLTKEDNVWKTLYD